ncbi:DUF697 domain-containing protein [Periweissella cryptocerci]|uniref:DUF697 domain-containing protein n=1 Tax=Periweissella cryptocerci TaxID=2506420 RepID=A0A4P6YWI5_9LACO|nr:DUF697 domain-containing protein [Periweissella cryptocerci]QBO37156.1 DUF697 domain-containing protein [Periweissella cryptocerci]
MPMTAVQQKQVGKIIHGSSIAAAGVGAAPIPFVDALPITALQINMIIQIGKVFDQYIAKSALMGITQALAVTAAGRGVVALVPVVGWGVNATVAGALTEALGWSVANSLADGVKPETIFNPQNVPALMRQVVQMAKHKR